MQGNTWLFIKVTLEGVVFAFLFSRQGFRQQQQEVVVDLAGLALCSQASYEGGQLSLLLLDGCMRTACAGPHHTACLQHTRLPLQLDIHCLGILSCLACNGI